MIDDVLRVLIVALVAVVIIHITKAHGAERDNSIMYLCCSVHEQEEENEWHEGVFYQRHLSDEWSVIVGTFQNSQDRRSMLLGARWDTEITENWDAFVVTGVVTGYGEMPLGAVTGLEYRDRVQLYIVPGVVYAIGITVVRW